jgi:hypothetical protein
MKLRQPIALCGLLAVLLAAGMCLGQAAVGAATAPDGVEFFEKKVRPLLSEHCYQCHSAGAPKGIKGGLVLDSREGLLRGGDSGPAIASGSPDGSRLIRAVRWKDDKLQMPPKRALAPEQVAVLEQWVAMGAPDPRVATAAAPAPATGAMTLEQAKQYWAYQPVKDPAVPVVNNVAWPKSAVDCFVLAKLEGKGLSPAPQADKRALIRRATFDLTGLPPTPEYVEAFVADSGSDAF